MTTITIERALLRDLYDSMDDYYSETQAGRDLRAAAEAALAAPEEGPLATSITLAATILSDCGISTDYVSLHERVAARITKYVDELLATWKRLQAPATAPKHRTVSDDLIACLRGGRQCDADGVEVIMSRQACCEAADILESWAIDQAPATAPDLSDAYIGAREDLAIWKKRALEAEETARQLAHALAEEVNGPTFMADPVKPAPAQPSWQDAPTKPGVWFCDEGDICYTWTAHNIEILDQFDPGSGLRWYGPIPQEPAP